MNQNSRIYLDYAATTPVDERVVNAMLPYFSQTFGNPSSTHFFGQQAEGALMYARRKVATLINGRPEEIFFTSGGTEGNNLALRGGALQQLEKRGANHILISEVEHHAVSHTAAQLADRFGFILEMLPVDEFGRVSAEDVAHMIRPETAMVSVIYANNEIGTINPIREISAVCRERGVPFH
ncbi:MAG: aminotransferase class V-fold PLP-dependent enzyme, partial [Anaerolineae bacterium]|nr:aminotransferase class V-fold PLP-dependent enzyme [Anaerolineae bacterium]